MESKVQILIPESPDPTETRKKSHHVKQEPLCSSSLVWGLRLERFGPLSPKMVFDPKVWYLGVWCSIIFFVPWMFQEDVAVLPSPVFFCSIYIIQPLVFGPLGFETPSNLELLKLRSFHAFCSISRSAEILKQGGENTIDGWIDLASI